MADGPSANYLINLLLRQPNADPATYQQGGLSAPDFYAMLDSISGGKPSDSFGLDNLNLNASAPVADGVSASAGLSASQEKHQNFKDDYASPNVGLQIGPARIGAAYDINNFNGYGENTTTGNVRVSPGLDIPIGKGSANLTMDRTVGMPNQFTAGYQTPLMGGTLEAGANYTPQTRLLSALLNYKKRF